MTEVATVHATQRQILDAATTVLRSTGHGGLSLRQVADQAGLGLGHIHYHFGTRRKLVLAVLDEENAKRLARQEAMYDADLSLSKQWDQACDFLEDDLEAGYVRVLHEMIAASWSDPEIAQHVRELVRGWFELLTTVGRRVDEQLGGLGPFSAEEIATLVGDAFLGAEALILLGLDEGQGLPHRQALRRLGDLIRTLETT